MNLVIIDALKIFLIEKYGITKNPRLVKFFLSRTQREKLFFRANKLPKLR